MAARSKSTEPETAEIVLTDEDVQRLLPLAQQKAQVEHAAASLDAQVGLALREIGDAHGVWLRQESNAAVDLNAKVIRYHVSDPSK